MEENSVVMYDTRTLLSAICKCGDVLSIPNTPEGVFIRNKWVARHMGHGGDLVPA